MVSAARGKLKRALDAAQNIKDELDMTSRLIRIEEELGKNSPDMRSEHRTVCDEVDTMIGVLTAGMDGVDKTRTFGPVGGTLLEALGAAH